MPHEIIFFHTVATLAGFLEQRLNHQAADQSVPPLHCTHVAHPALLDALINNEDEDTIYKDFKAIIDKIKQNKPAAKIMVTCSSLGAFCARYTQDQKFENLYCIDRAMMSAAANNNHKNIALVVSNNATIKPSKQTLRDALSRLQANAAIPHIDIIDIRDDMATITNARTQDALRTRLTGYDGIILAQVSIGKAFEEAGIHMPAMLYKSYDEGMRPLLTSA